MLLLFIQMEEVVFGGVGSGLYGMLAFVMLLARFLPMIGTLAIANSMSKKKVSAKTVGTLSTTNATFVFFLILIVLLAGALSFFSALSLGPFAEFFRV